MVGRRGEYILKPHSCTAKVQLVMNINKKPRKKKKQSTTNILMRVKLDEYTKQNIIRRRNIPYATRILSKKKKSFSEKKITIEGKLKQ